jgi:hypothetical protein
MCLNPLAIHLLLHNILIQSKHVSLYLCIYMYILFESCPPVLNELPTEDSNIAKQEHACENFHLDNST